jgi:hypothetical protein
MNDSFFDRLEAELAGLARQGTQLEGAPGRNRRGAVIMALAVVLAASLVSEFPASASGRAMAAAQVSVLRGL